MRSIAATKNGCKGLFKAIDRVVSLLAIFYRTSSKRGGGGRGQAFRRRTGVRWVEAMFGELDVVVANLQALQKHATQYIALQTDAGCKQKAEDLLEVERNEIFSASTAFFANVFQVVRAISKNTQQRHGLKVDIVRGMVYALCSQLMYMKRKPVDGGWEQHFGYDLAVCPIQVARTHFLSSLILDLQGRFAREVWVQQNRLIGLRQHLAHVSVFCLL